MSDHPRESDPSPRSGPTAPDPAAQSSEPRATPDATAPLPATDIARRAADPSRGGRPEQDETGGSRRDDADDGRLDAETMDLPAARDSRATGRSAPDGAGRSGDSGGVGRPGDSAGTAASGGAAPAGYFAPGASGPAAPPRRGQQIDSDPGRRNDKGLGEHPTSDFGTRGLGPDAGQAGDRTAAFEPVTSPYGSARPADPTAYRGAGGTAGGGGLAAGAVGGPGGVGGFGAGGATGAAGGGFGGVRRAPTDESPMADYRAYSRRPDDDDDAGLDIADDDEVDGARTRRRGQGAAGLVGVIGLGGAAFGAFGLPLQSRGGTEVFYGNLREVASRSGGLLLRVNTSRSTDIGNEMARFVWRIGFPFALGVCGLLLLGVLCWPFMRKAAGVLLGIVALVTGVGVVLGARGTRDFRGGLDRAGGSALGLFKWDLGLYVALGGLLLLLIAGAIAGVQSRE